MRRACPQTKRGKESWYHRHDTPHNAWPVPGHCALNMADPAIYRIPTLLPPAPIRRKVFVSYFRADRLEVEEFVDRWADQENVFLPQIVGAFGRGIIKSNNAEYVIGRIRTEEIADSTVTLVLMGSCTHSRRHVDWEIQASLRRGADSLPNGLLGIVLPSQGSVALLPPRFEMNWVPENRDGYARYYVAPKSADGLRAMIEDAFRARRSRADLIKNPRESMEYNAQCKICGVTHSRRIDSKIRGAVRGSVLTAPPGAKRCFVVNFNPFSLSRQALLDFLDTQPDVLNWLFSYSLHGQVLLVAERSCSEIASLLRARFPAEFFTVSTISEMDGKMSQVYWDFVNAPKSSGHWDGLSPLAQLLLSKPPDRR
jgi:hypothetical protein